jgi:hypothetical protein
MAVNSIAVTMSMGHDFGSLPAWLEKRAKKSLKAFLPNTCAARDRSTDICGEADMTSMGA